MSSTRRMAFCRSPPMKIAVQAPQGGKAFYVHKDLVTKRSAYSKDLFVRPYSRELFHGGPNRLRAIASSRKGESLHLCGMLPPAPSGPQMGMSEYLP